MFAAGETNEALPWHCQLLPGCFGKCCWAELKAKYSDGVCSDRECLSRDWGPFWVISLLIWVIITLNGWDESLSIVSTVLRKSRQSL